MAVPDRLFRTCCRHFLAVPVGTPNASVLSELRLDDSSRITVKLGPRLVAALDSETRTSPCFNLPFGDSCPWHMSWSITRAGSQNSRASTLRRWSARAMALGRAWQQGLVFGLSAFHTVRFACSTSL